MAATAPQIPSEKLDKMLSGVQQATSNPDELQAVVEMMKQHPMLVPLVKQYIHRIVNEITQAVNGVITKYGTPK
jgi:hypothetical protein